MSYVVVLQPVTDRWWDRPLYLTRFRSFVRNPRDARVRVFSSPYEANQARQDAIRRGAPVQRLDVEPAPHGAVPNFGRGFGRTGVGHGDYNPGSVRIYRGAQAASMIAQLLRPVMKHHSGGIGE